MSVLNQIQHERQEAVKRGAVIKNLTCHLSIDKSFTLLEESRSIHTSKVLNDKVELILARRDVLMLKEFLSDTEVYGMPLIVVDSVRVS